VNKTINPRRFARVKAGGRVSNAAKIVVGPKDPMIDCALIDFSAGGACLEIAPQTALPPRFELVHGNTRKRCRLVWKAGRRIGVSF
jgi:PilZ domain